MATQNAIDNGNGATVAQKNVFSNYIATGLSANVDLTNATNFPICPSYISVSFTAGTFKIIMPSTSAINAPQLGKEIVIKNTGTLGQEFAIVAQDGSTTIVATVQVGDYIRLQLTSTGTANGSWNAQVINTMAGQASNSVAITGGTISGLNSALGTASGGTGATSFVTNTGIVKYNNSGRLETSATAIIDSSERITNSSQPLVMGYVNANVSNQTGDGTSYTIVFNSTLVNQGSMINTGTGIVTVPKTANYLISGSVGFLNVGAGNTFGIINIVTTSRTFQVCSGNYAAMRDSNNNLVLTFPSLVTPLTANDTIRINVHVDSSTKTVGILGDGTNPLTFLTVWLIPS